MRKEFLKHQLSYSILLILVLLFVFLFFAFWPNRYYQRILVLDFSTAYFLWGIITHVKTEKINQKVIMEYVSISLLIGVILFLITL